MISKKNRNHKTTQKNEFKKFARKQAIKPKEELVCNITYVHGCQKCHPHYGFYWKYDKIYLLSVLFCVEKSPRSPLFHHFIPLTIIVIITIYNNYDQNEKSNPKYTDLQIETKPLQEPIASFLFPLDERNLDSHHKDDTLHQKQKETFISLSRALAWQNAGLFFC